MNCAASSSAGHAEMSCLARAGGVVVFLSVKGCKLPPAALPVQGVMGASIAREVAQAGELRLAPSQLLPAPLRRHVLCLQHGNLCCLAGGFRQEGKCLLVLGWGGNPSVRWPNSGTGAQRLWKLHPWRDSNAPGCSHEQPDLTLKVVLL